MADARPASAIQHVLAMFGATFVFPPIMGIPGNIAIMFSGIGTLIFLLIVRNRIPSYLGTSAAFIARPSRSTTAAATCRGAVRRARAPA